MKTAVIAFGRLNPPTMGHGLLIKSIKKISDKKKGTPMMFLSQSQDAKKNPLGWKEKVEFSKKLFGVNWIMNEPSVKNPFDAMKYAQSKGFTHVVFVAGSDRVDEYTKMFNKYNNTETYSFDSIEVVSAGQRDPDAEGVAGISASKMRQFVVDGDFESFRRSLPKSDMNLAQNVYNTVKKGMNL